MKMREVATIEPLVQEVGPVCSTLLELGEQQQRIVDCIRSTGTYAEDQGRGGRQGTGITEEEFTVRRIEDVLYGCHEE